MTDSNALRPYGPGKFSTILDSYVYDVTLGGCADDSVIVGGQHYDLMRNGRTIFKDHDPFCESLTEGESDYLSSQAGVIVTEDNYGFVYVSYYADMGELDQAWDKLTADADTDEDGY